MLIKRKHKINLLNVKGGEKCGVYKNNHWPSKRDVFDITRLELDFCGKLTAAQNTPSPFANVFSVFSTLLNECYCFAYC